MDIIINRAVPEDAGEILSFLKQIGGESDNLSFGGEGLGFSMKDEESYLFKIQSSQDDIMLVARCDGKIVGSASLNRLPRRMNHRGDFSVSVLKNYWNMGIGTKLLCAIIDYAKNCGFEMIDLQVRSDNLSAIHLYEKCGFKKIGVHPAFFKIANKGISFDYMYLNLK